jgi:pimeloyl-ACP methyl ester carboxylesterase
MAGRTQTLLSRRCHVTELQVRTMMTPRAVAGAVALVIPFWVGIHVGRDQVIKLVLATPPQLLTAAGPQERARIDALLDNILPVSARVEGLRADTITGKHLVPAPLASIRAPTLIISARDDLYGTYAGAAYTAAQIPGAKFIGFDHGGHTWVGHDAEVRSEIVKLLLRSAGP